MALEFDLTSDAPASIAADCVIVGVFADKTLTDPAAAIDRAAGGRLSALIERGDVSGKAGRTALLHDLPDVAAPRVLVVGLGEQAKFGVAQYVKAVGDAARALKAGPVRHAVSTLAQIPDLLQMNGTPEDRAACEPDARRYCKNAMPDNMRVLSCLQQNRRKISRACQAVLTKYGQ